MRASTVVLSRLLALRKPTQGGTLCSFHPCSNFASSSASHTLSVQSRGLHATVPASGVFSGVRGAYDEAVKGSESKREQKIFNAQMKYLTDDSRRFNGDLYLELVSQMMAISGMGGMKQHLPWVQNNPALDEMKKQERVVSALTPAERKDVFSVSIGSKKRIAVECETPLDNVESVLSHISLMIRMQKWLVGRQKEGLLMPKTSIELQNMIMDPASGMRKGGKGRRGMPSPGVKRGRNPR